MFLELQTPSEKKKPFRCKEVDGGELIVYPSDKRGRAQSKEAYAITPFIPDLVKTTIRDLKEIEIGASRDKPKRGSLGDLLKSQGLSPQYLSYVIGYLISKGYCHVSGNRPTRIRYIEHLQSER